MKQKQQQKQCGESLLTIIIDINLEIMEISDEQYFVLVQNIL